MNSLRYTRPTTLLVSSIWNTQRGRTTTTLLATFAVAGLGVSLTSFNKETRLDSAATMSKTFAFPQNMLFSKRLSVVKSEQINHDTKLITFALPGGESEISGLPAGAAILTQHTPKDGWIPVLRPYTPIHDLEKPGILQLLVKKYPGGRASGHLHSLHAGDELTVRGPIPTYYKWKESSSPKDVVFIAGGAGVTPIYSLARGILHGDKNTRIHLLWGVNSSQDILLKKELRDLKAMAGNGLRITYFVSGPRGQAEIDEAKATTSVDADFLPGRIDKAAIEKLLTNVGGLSKLGDQQGTKVFMCGPPAMEDALAGKQGILQELGIIKKQIHQF